MSSLKMRSYDKEFKLNAVKLYLESGTTYKKISSDLGIPTATLVGWVEEHKKSGIEAFPGKGYLRPSDAEVGALRKELAIVREERDILKKALGIFSSTRK
jgi:transposase-like protein